MDKTKPIEADEIGEFLGALEVVERYARHLDRRLSVEASDAVEILSDVTRCLAALSYLSVSLAAKVSAAEDRRRLEACLRAEAASR